jgi:hypothetical protein
MVHDHNRLPLARPRMAVGFLLTTLATLLAPAATVWNGPVITYNQPGTDPTQPANQDRLTDKVWLSRGSSSGMINARTETFYTHFVSPADTEWALGTLENFASLTYTSWEAAGSGRPVMTLVGKPLVLHLISDDIYLSVKFTKLGSTPVGAGFAYERSTPGSAPPPSPPAVTMTNPVEGAVFVAPADVVIAASATASSGSVTNVSFYGNGALLGSVQSPPFSIAANDLPVGTHALTAVATAEGISATSSVVNITVTSPAPVVSITNPLAGASYVAPANLRIEAAASVGGGVITNVSFHGNEILLGSVQAAPFSITVSNLAAADYALTAVATAAGISTTSAVVGITVTLPAPEVTITNPLTGTGFVAPADVSVAATASAAMGAVTNVAFFANGGFLGSAHTSPFSITASNLVAGNYALMAVATAAGVSATSSVVSITVTPPPPTVSITNPLAGAVLAAPANLFVSASAAVNVGAVTNVSFFGNTGLLGTVQSSPFSLTVSNLAAGSYALTAVAAAAGISATSSVVNVSVVVPVAIVISSQGLLGDKYSFDYTANPGLTYLVQFSSNLTDWLIAATNTATNNPVHFSDDLISTGDRFYRVGLLP